MVLDEHEQPPYSCLTTQNSGVHGVEDSCGLWFVVVVVVVNSIYFAFPMNLKPIEVNHNQN